MATVEDCRAALTRLAKRMAANAEEVHAKVKLDRGIECRITDLDIAFRGRLRDGELIDLTEGGDSAANITLSTSSDDLIAMVDGELDLAKALATRRVSISAGPLDLLKLRKLL